MTIHPVNACSITTASLMTWIIPSAGIVDTDTAMVINIAIVNGADGLCAKTTRYMPKVYAITTTVKAATHIST